MLYDPKWDTEVSPSVRDVLIDAKAQIENPENWRQGEFGFSTNATCAFGAVVRGANRLNASKDVFHAVSASIDGAAHGSVIRFNDSHTHAEVLALFDRAIASA